jgi:hypothetical protein
MAVPTRARPADRVCSNLALPYGAPLLSVLPDTPDAVILSYEVGLALVAGRRSLPSGGCQIAACQLGDDHGPGVGVPIRTRKCSSVLELDPIDEVDQGGGIIIVEIVALAEPPECMDRPVTFDRRHNVLMRLGRGHNRSTENPIPMIRIMFHVSSIAIATSDRIGRNQP